MPFFAAWRNLRHRPLIEFPHARDRSFLLFCHRTLIPQVPQRALLQSCIIKPHVVVPSVVRQLLFVLYAPFPEDGGFERRPRAMLFFEFRVRGIQSGRFRAGNARQGELRKEDR